MAGLGASTLNLRGRTPNPCRVGRLDVLADRAENLADRCAQEEQGEDRHDGDEGEDQRVLRETLAFLVAIEKSNKSGKHGGPVPPSLRDPPNRNELPPMRESVVAG